MNTLTESSDLRSALTSFCAASVLHTLLSLCDRPDVALNSAERLTQQYAAMNAVRLWTLVTETMGHFNEPVRTVSVDGPKGRWRWPTDGFGVQTGTQFHVEIKAAHSILALCIHIQALPSLVPDLNVKSATSRSGRRVWVTEPAAVPMGYAQARAFLTALSFSIDADRLVLDNTPGHVQ